MALASHGFAQQDSIGELAERGMYRVNSRLSQANLSLALTNFHGNSNTHLSSGRTSQAGRARAKLARQAANIYMSNNVTTSQGLDASSQLRDTEAATLVKQGGALGHDFASSQDPSSVLANRFSQGAARKQSMLVGKAAQQFPTKQSASAHKKQRPKTAALRRSHNAANAATNPAAAASFYQQPSQLTESDVPVAKNRPKTKLSLKRQPSPKDKRHE